MPDIQFLTQRVADLDYSISKWNNWYVFFVAATVVLAAGLFVTQFVSMRKSRELAKAQAELIRLKDDSLSQDLKEKDLEIAHLKDEATKAEGGIALAKTDAAKATENAAMANERAAEANKAAENERIARLKLEAEVSPRRLTNDQANAIASACRAFAGRKVRVTSYSLDAEGGILAKQIIAALSAGRMNVDDQTASVLPLGSFSLGVHVDGKELDMVTALSTILSTNGGLLVAPPNWTPANSPAITTGNPGSEIL